MSRLKAWDQGRNSGLSSIRKPAFYSATALFFFFSRLGAFYDTFEQKYFLFSHLYALAFMSNYNSTTGEDLFLKVLSTIEKQPPDSLPWGRPLLTILGGSSPSIQVHVPGDMAVLMASSVSLNHKRIPQYTSTYWSFSPLRYVLRFFPHYLHTSAHCT